MGNTVFLCGMPGSGKSTLGKKLAGKLGWRFTDLDEEILRKSGKSPAEWLTNSGEPAFRKEEANQLRALDLNGNLVVACGGGTPCFEENLDWMQQNGVCIFLHVPLKGLEQRLNQSKGVDDRPLLQGNANRLSELWEQREPYFKKISWWFDGLDADVSKLALDIQSRLGK
jgi:shikimate kinase